MVDFNNTPVNIFFEIEQTGEIVKGCGFSQGFIHFVYEDGNHNRISKANASEGWIPRHDLKQFPGDTEVLLPYVFDLFFDCKTVSELERTIEWAMEAGQKDTVNEIMEMVQENKIELTLDNPQA